MTENLMPMAAILALAAGTFAFRATGPLLHGRLVLSGRMQQLFQAAAVVILVSLMASSALLDGAAFAGWARPAGVAAGLGFYLLRAPFPVIVIGAAAVTAALRASGIA
ncbi:MULTISPECIES: AzlD domain-containing protein [unclassified Pannonibacter]|uniref:AzlD domain-containing protein n=1 Tax=unclassified Pannonibacter TaxID=2627228 RepID=UPI0016461B36|nr:MULTISPECIES: AzlD domain-containing protein [unclassified Pannonibacter]